MAKAKTRGQNRYRRPHSLAQAFDGEHKLVLLWLDTVLPRRFFTEVKELADLVSKIR